LSFGLMLMKEKQIKR